MQICASLLKKWNSLCKHLLVFWAWGGSRMVEAWVYPSPSRWVAAARSQCCCASGTPQNGQGGGDSSYTWPFPSPVDKRLTTYLSFLLAEIILRKKGPYFTRVARDSTSRLINLWPSVRTSFYVWSDKRHRQLTELILNTKMPLRYPLHF